MHHLRIRTGHRLLTSFFWPYEPSFVESNGNTVPGYTGNPNLKPETSLSYEAGIKRSDKIFRESFAWFSREIKNMINDYAPNLNNIYLYEPQNIENARIFGFEGKINVSINEKDVIQAGYTYMNAVNVMTNVKLPNAPEGKFNASLEKEFPFSIKAKVEYEYIDSRINSSGYMLKPYSMLNAGISQKLSENLDVSVEVSNIFNNTNYNTYYNTLYNVESGYLMPGRTIMAGGQIAF